MTAAMVSGTKSHQRRYHKKKTNISIQNKLLRHKYNFLRIKKKKKQTISYIK